MFVFRLMDCLVCGDVGFGKIEVVMCVVFVVVYSGKQVVVLVFIILFVQQYYNSFCDCFVDWLVSVEVMSCFKSVKEVENVVWLLVEGKIDIFIGIYKLFQEDVKFVNLGLVVIDEEYCFGVCQKEQFKVLCSEVDIFIFIVMLILWILNMVVFGMCDLFIIVMLLVCCLLVCIFVMEQQNVVIKEVLFCELLCGGQVYYLYNEVKIIEKCVCDFVELVLEVCIGIGYGQMYECELEQVMSDFYYKCFNVLVVLIIIEIGIDVFSVNIIFIECVDKFGLVQLYQLCGCVGCSYYQVYVYLLILLC